MVTVLAVVILLGGLICAAMPLGNWMVISFGGLDATISGLGVENTDDLDDFSDDSSDADGVTSSSSEDDDQLDWVLGPIPDGVPITLLGLVAAAIGLVLVLRATSPPPDVERARKERMTLAAAVTAVAGAGFLWILLSWFNLDRQWDDVISELMDESGGFGAMFVAGIDFSPGYGLYLAGLGMAALGVCAAALFFVTYSRMEKMPVAVSFSPGSGADTAQGPSSDQQTVPPHPGFAPVPPPSAEGPGQHPPAGPPPSTGPQPTPPPVQGPPSGQYPPSEPNPSPPSATSP